MSVRLELDAVEYGEAWETFNDCSDQAKYGILNTSLWFSYGGWIFRGMVMIHLLPPSPSTPHTHTPVLCTSLSCQETTMSFIAQAPCHLTTHRGLPIEGLGK